MNRTAIFPGSFDPITIGHSDLVRRALLMFDKIIIAVGENSLKKPMFPTEQRLEWLCKVFAGEPKITVETYHGLTVDFCKSRGAKYILRGLRSVNDFDFEKNIAQMNHALDPGIESIFLVCDPAHTAISSTIVRDILANGGDASFFLPVELAGIKF